jgi:4-amino-4-deoxy-L-arabinose transferase
MEAMKNQRKRLVHTLKCWEQTGRFSRMRTHFIALGSGTVGLLLLFVAVYLLPLNLRQLSIPDEMRYGEIAREMLATGDFVTPRLNGLRYFEKPAGGHALNAVSLAVFGETNFGVRFMSALATGLGALALVLLVKKETDARTAMLAGFMVLTCVMVMGIGTFSLLDAMVTGFITLALCCFYPALTATGKKQLGWLALTGVFAGGAFLVKGFVALAVPVLVIAPYLLLRKEWKRLFTLPWIPLITALIVSLPWCIAIAMQESDFWRYFFFEEHIRRFFSSEEAQHQNPIWYYIPVFIGGAAPWILIAPLALFRFLRTRLGEPLVQFSICWFIMPFLFFSASSGKLGTYILPCFTPFALLLAMAMKDDHERDNRSIQTGITVFTAIIAIALLALPVAAILACKGMLPQLDDHVVPKFIALFLAFLIALLLLIRAIRKGPRMEKLILLGCTTALLFTAVEACLPVEVSSALSLQQHLESQQDLIEPDTILIGHPKTVHAMSYVYKRSDIYLTDGTGEMTYGLGYPDAEHRFLEPNEARELIEQRGTNRVVMAIHSRPDDRSVKDKYPKPDAEHQWLKIWYAIYEPLPKNQPSE